VIPLALWRQVSDPAAKPPASGLRFGLDVAPDRSSAAICVSAGKVVELVEHAPGTGWVVGRCNELTARHRSSIALDEGGPAGVFASQLKRLTPMSGRAVIDACAAMFDAITEGAISFRADPAFDAAVEGVAKKPVGDRWVWSRKASAADVTPLMAATLAFSAPGPPAAPAFRSLREGD